MSHMALPHPGVECHVALKKLDTFLCNHLVERRFLITFANTLFLMPQSQGMTSYEKNIIKYNKNTKQ